MFLDRISWMNQDIGITGALIAGLIITLISLKRLNKILD
jgi:hypothetical protein